MRKAAIVGAFAFLTTGVASAAGQATGTPSYNAPYRAFARYEFGGTLSFAKGDATGIEGQVRLGQGTVDFGFRGGFVDEAGTATVVLGGSGRLRVLTHSEQFPLDGAVIVGGGTRGFDNFMVPVGISLGRRLDVEGSDVSIVPYAQPTLSLVFDDNANSNVVNLSFGFGGDFRLTRFFDLRVSGSVGDVEGISVSAVWIR